MQKTGNQVDETTDIPELTDAELKRARRVTPRETEAFRLAIEEKLGVSRPPRIGRPPKRPSDKYVPISWRTPPEVMKWLITQARNAGVGKYQTFLSLLLRGMMLNKRGMAYAPATRRLPSLPPGIDGFFARALHADPERRPRSAEAFISELDSIA